MSYEYLKVPIRRRLEMFKRAKTACAYYTKPDGSRYLTPIRPSVMNAHFNIGSCRCQWQEEADELSTHRLRWCDEIDGSYIKHRGWYIDSHQDETARGIVLTLPRRRGYLAGIAAPFNFNREDMVGPAIIEVGEIYATAEEAARGADHITERYAEDAREGDAKFQAEQQIETALEEASGLRQEIVALVQGIRDSKLNPVVCARLTEDIRAILAEKTELYERIEELTDNPWKAVES